MDLIFNVLWPTDRIAAMPVADINIPEAKKIFDVNVWSFVAVTQAFLPLLLASSNAMIVNHTSVASVSVTPLLATYAASKAAAAAFTQVLRMELEALDIKVVELKTGAIKTNITQNLNKNMNTTLPAGSIYDAARPEVEAGLRQEALAKEGTEAAQWAKETVRDLLRKNPPTILWRGQYSLMVWLGTFFPSWALDGTTKRVTGFDKVEEKMKAQRKVK